jgi:hypothetical protein
MGQAAVDLPDPLSKPPSPLSGADDLLSQMAGEQIDRLIAESESAKAAIATPNDPFASQLDDLFNQLNSAPADLVTVEQSVVEPPPAPVAPPPLVVEATPAAVVEEPPAPQPIAAIEQPTSAAERAALTPPIDPVAAIEALPPPAPAAASDEERVSILVRVLELINAPFAACPDMLRDMLGKLAILTLMNSIGVILYVVIFRKH